MNVGIREAINADVASIRDLFVACYGADYTDPEYYEEEFLRKLVYSDDILVLVAEETGSGKVVGSAAVILETGAYTDLVGEFGRLVVHPDHRRVGVGTKLMDGRVERVRDRLQVGLIEGRITHPFTQKISVRHGFAPVGFLPMVSQFGEQRESYVLLARYFGNALELRRNHPRIVPEAYHVALVAMEAIGVRPDVIVDEEASAYPHIENFDVRELSVEGYASLLRIERGRVRRREVFGPLSLNHGVFKIKARQSNYLIASRSGRVVGAIGFTHDTLERNVKVFELISLDEQTIRFLLEELERRYLHEWDVMTVEIGVSAYAPRMQRTMIEMGFLPVAYVPALAFHRVERLDVVKFLRLLAPLHLGDIRLIPAVKGLAELVLEGFSRGEVFRELREAVDTIGLFEGLTQEQTHRVAATCGHVKFDAGTKIFSPGDPSTEMYLVMRGKVDVTRPDGSRLGTVEAGQCLGEVALLSETEHSAVATARRDVHAGTLTRDNMQAMVRRRPDIGVVLYRNVARDVGDKLRRADMERAERD